ncbi:ABC transporter permease [Candidatus Bathyarchaeota archaeon]|nr:MAG: ABC transporter permease [Candidatus Bathyarchaeota archaeon]
MRATDIISMSFEGLNSRKFRFALNLIGILIGCAAVTGLITLTQGMSVEISGQLGSLGGSTITVMAGSRFGPGSNMGNQANTVTLDWREVKIISGLSDVKLVAPIASGGSASYTLKGDTYYVSITGITDLYFSINEGTIVEEGRTFTRNDNGVAIIGYGVANPSTGDGNIKVGDRVKLTSEVNNVEKVLTVRIIGILEETGGMMGGDTSFYIPLDTYEQFFITNGVYSSIQVIADEGVNIEYLAETIEEKISGITALTAASTMEMINSVIGTIEAVLGGVAAISLLVAGVGIVNTMTVSVMERTKEIGTMKAIGAKSRDILYLFISEAAMTGFAGGILGALFGFLLGNVVGNYVGISASPTLILGMLVVGFAMVTSIISGLYPAWSASNLNPVEALRGE